MVFTAPVWLFALIPWLGLGLWLLWGRRKRHWVPFLKLWDMPHELRRPQDKSIQLPPLAVVLAWLGLLGGILAIAQPAWVHRQNAPITIVLDRGGSMSAMLPDTVAGEAARRAPRFAIEARRLQAELVQILGDSGRIRLVDPVDAAIIETDLGHWAGIAEGWKRTALRTDDALHATVAAQVQRGGPVLVVSDRWIAASGAPSIIAIKPQGAIRNGGISLLAAARGQAMVRIKSNYEGSRSLTVASGQSRAQVEVKFLAGTDHDVFVDLPQPGPTLEARLDPSDDFEGDDVAYLTRGPAWPTVEVRTPIPEPVRRIIGVYRRHRPAGDSARRIGIVAPDQVTSEEPQVVVAPVSGEEIAVGTLTLAGNHPILAAVDVGPLSRAMVAAKGPGEGWTALVQAQGRTLVAVRTTSSDARQVWVGFESREFARNASFALLWTNILDWAGAGDPEYRASQLGFATMFGKRILPGQLPADVDGRWWPGVSETASGPVALNAPPAESGSGRGDSGTANLGALRSMASGQRDLAPWVALAALVLLAGSAATWEQQRRPRSAAATAPDHLAVETEHRVENVIAANGHAHRRETDVPPA